MMYTKEGEFDVSLVGGSPWGFTIRTQEGNGLYNRGKVIVAKIVQGGKADSSGNIHVGDEILAVNGLEFDNEQQATTYVKGAKKELILRVKRGQDKRRMNIRLAGELPNYFAKALESPFEKNEYTLHHSDAMMVSNNKRSSKEYEKDLSYSLATNTVNAVIDYPSAAHSQINMTRLTRSTADLSEYMQPKDQHYKDNLSSSPLWKNDNRPRSPDPRSPEKVQRVRITSTNVTSPGNYKYSSDKSSSPSFDGSLGHSDSRSSTPSGYSASVQKPSFNSSAMEELNRTWPSASISDTSVKVTRKSGFSVSAAKSHFEQMSREQRPAYEGETRSSLSTSLVAPKPPSRNSSFRSTRLSSASSSALPETEAKSPSSDRHFSQDTATTRRSSSSEELDKPLPPRRFSKSVVLDSMRSNKKSSNVPATLSPDQEIGYHHSRTQSLPSSKIVTTHLSSKSWVMDDDEDATNEDSSKLLPRSSSFSRARVIETTGVQTVHRSQETRKLRDSPVEVAAQTAQRDNTKSPNFAKQSDVKYNRASTPAKIIQTLRTVEVSCESGNTDSRGSLKQEEERNASNDKWSKQEYNVASKADQHKPDSYQPKPQVQPKSILKRETPKIEPKPKLSKPVLKENSLMQRLLLEAQGQGGSSERSTAATIEEEINQRTGKVSITSRSSGDAPNKDDKDQRLGTVSVKYKPKENVKVQETKPRNMSKESEVIETPLNRDTRDSSNDVDDSTSKIDHCLDQLTDSPAIKHEVEHEVLQKVDSLGDDNVFTEPTEQNYVATQEDEPFESNIDDVEEECSSAELTVKSPDSVLESSPDNNENITEQMTPDQHVGHRMKKTIENKHADTLSRADAPLKIVHSRENSASSLLEETLESAKTIASIYSVEGPTRTPDGEDCLHTASEMRRHSLAKRVRRRPQLESSTFTPERDQEQSSFSEPTQNEDDGNRSTGSSGGSRPDSGILSPKLEALEEQKEILISSMKKKVELLKEQESEINEEMKQNDDLGKRVAEEVKAKTSGAEYSKFDLFVGELNNIIGLLLSLTQRMHRYEVSLQNIDLAEENGRDKRDVLLKRIERVKQQYEEACRIKEINDKRGEAVSKIVEDYCSDEEFADFQHFVDMKTQLALTQAEIRDKIKLGEEKLNALTSAHIDWTTLDLSLK